MMPYVFILVVLGAFELIVFGLYLLVTCFFLPRAEDLCTQYRAAAAREEQRVLFEGAKRWLETLHRWRKILYYLMLLGLALMFLEFLWAGSQGNI